MRLTERRCSELPRREVQNHCEFHGPCYGYCQWITGPRTYQISLHLLLGLIVTSPYTYMIQDWEIRERYDCPVCHLRLSEWTITGSRRSGRRGRQPGTTSTGHSRVCSLGVAMKAIAGLSRYKYYVTTNLTIY